MKKVRFWLQVKKDNNQNSNEENNYSQVDNNQIHNEETSNEILNDNQPSENENLDSNDKNSEVSENNNSQFDNNQLPNEETSNEISNNNQPDENENLCSNDKNNDKHKYRFFSNKLVLRKLDLAHIFQIISHIYYPSKTNRVIPAFSLKKMQNTERSDYTFFKFLIACDNKLPSNTPNQSEGVIVHSENIDKDIYNIYIEDKRNNLGRFCINLSRDFNIRDSSQGYSYNQESCYTKLALKKHYELIHKNLISRAKEKLESKPQNLEKKHKERKNIFDRFR